MSWLPFALFSLICFVVYDLAGRYLATKSANPRAFATIYNAIVTLFTPLLFLLEPTLPQKINLQTVFLTIIGLVVWGLFGRFEYYARQHTQASVFNIIVKLAPVINFFLAILVLSEKLTVNKLVGVVLIIASNLILFLGDKQNQVISPKGLKYMLLVSLLLAFGWLFDAINVKHWGVATFAIFSFLAPTIASGLFPTIKFEELKKELSLSPWWHITLLGFFNLAGYGSMLKALTLGPASNVMPVVTSTTPIVVLVGILLFKESNFVVRKLAAGLLIPLAIYLMR